MKNNRVNIVSLIENGDLIELNSKELQKMNGGGIWDKITEAGKVAWTVVGISFESIGIMGMDAGEFGQHNLYK